MRHLAAARFFETLGTDELAGALAGHYLAAHGYAAEGPEADALAAQARVALRGAAERAAALGAHEQAIAFLEQRWRSARTPADRADLHERAPPVGDAGPVGARCRAARARGWSRRGASWAIARRSPWRRRLRSGDRVLRDRRRAGARDLPAGLGGVLGPRGDARRRRPDAPDGDRYNFVQDDATALAWLERLLPIAERLDLLEATAAGLARGGPPAPAGSAAREPDPPARHDELAVANGLADVDRNTRTC